MAEVTTFVRYYQELRDTLNPCDITALLFSKDLISITEKAEIENMNFSVFQRMDKLLPAVQRAIKADKNNFYIFLEILSAIHRNKVIVERMRATLAG